MSTPIVPPAAVRERHQPALSKSEARPAGETCPRRPPAQGSRLSGAPHPLYLVSALALLEPLVGLAWQWAFARSVGAHFGLHHAAVLGFGLWLVYIGDHWLDVRHLDDGRTHTVRHAFVARQRGPIAIAWLFTLGLALLTACLTLGLAELLSGVALLAMTGWYFARVHGRSPRLRHKEVLVAVIYTGGVTVFCWPSLYAAPSPALLLPVSSFGLLVLLNLAIIASAEREVDWEQGQRSVAHRRPDLETLIRRFGGALALLWTTLLWLQPDFAWWYACLALSATLCVFIHAIRDKLHHDAFHMLADTALLTPLGWLLFSRI